MNAINYVSVDEFKNYNPETDFADYTDITISGLIQRASKIADNFLQYSLGVEDIVSEKLSAIVTVDGDLMIHPMKIPVQSVSAIALCLGEYSTDLTIVDSAGNPYYDLPNPANHILYPYQQLQLTGKVSIRSLFQIRERQFYVKISYRAGYTTIPADVKDAVNLITKDIFMRQTNPMNLRSVSQGGISVNYDMSESGKSDMTKDALETLMDYKKVW